MLFTPQSDFGRPLRLGTRGSPLALAQARLTAQALIAAHGWSADAIEIVTVQTSGDRIQDRALADIGGKALWTKELDRALVAGETDLSVHSMKDVETVRHDIFHTAAMLPRADPRDKLIGASSFDALPPNPIVGTSSPRRGAQVKRLRPDATITLFRGNVATRLAKLAAGEVHATLLAAAGWTRAMSARSSRSTRCCPPHRRAPWASKYWPATRLSSKPWRRSIIATRSTPS